MLDGFAIDGQTLVSDPYRDRRLVLEAMALSGQRWFTSSSFAEDSADVLDSCESVGLEPIVAKRRDSRYQRGRRSRNWVKVKTPRRVAGPRFSETEPPRRRPLGFRAVADSGIGRAGGGCSAADGRPRL